MHICNCKKYFHFNLQIGSLQINEKDDKPKAEANDKKAEANGKNACSSILESIAKWDLYFCVLSLWIPMMNEVVDFSSFPFINKGRRQKEMAIKPRKRIKVILWYRPQHHHIVSVCFLIFSKFSLVWVCVYSLHGSWLKLIWIADDKAAQSLLNKLIRSNLVNTTNQVEVLQRDPNSPLYSVKSFEELRLWVWLFLHLPDCIAALMCAD